MGSNKIYELYINYKGQVDAKFEELREDLNAIRSEMKDRNEKE